MQPGFAAGFGNQLPQTEQLYQRILEGRVRLRQQAQQQQAGEAFFKSLVTPDAAALPQQGPPGMQAPPPGTMAQGAGPTPPSMGAVPGLPTPPAGGAGAPPQASPPPTTPPAGGFQAPSGPAAGGPQSPQMGGGQFDPTQRLRAMAMQIKRANPGVDNATLAMALDNQIKTMRGVAPEDRIIMQMELAQQKFQSTRDIADLRADLERMKEGGRNDRFAAGESGKNNRAAISEQGKSYRFAQAQQNAQAGGIGDADAQILAEAWAAGDRSVTAGLGWGKAGAANRAKVLEAATKIVRDRGGSGEELAAAKADFMGTQAGARTASTQATRIGIASRELQKFIPPLLEASKAVNRSQFPTFNAVQMAAQRGTGGQAVVRLVSQVNAVKNAYAQIAARGGQSTDDARKRADEVMNAAWSNGQIEAGAKQLMVEADAALSAAEEAKGAATAPLRAGGKKPVGDAAAGNDGWSVEEVK